MKPQKNRVCGALGVAGEMVHSNHRRKHPKSFQPFCGIFIQISSVEKKEKKQGVGLHPSEAQNADRGDLRPIQPTAVFDRVVREEGDVCVADGLHADGFRLSREQRLQISILQGQYLAARGRLGSTPANFRKLRQVHTRPLSPPAKSQPKPMWR